jgi:Galactose-3-O-sulfotransferase
VIAPLPESPPCVVFLHLPKTGGRTLTATLRYKYPSRTLFLESTSEPLTAIGDLPLEQRRRARAVTGHLHYGVHRYIPQECEYITVLREPIARVLSTYRFIRASPKHWLHDELVGSDMGLEEFVRTAADPGVDNEQTRLLSGRGSGEMLWRGPDGRLHAHTPSPLGTDALAEAKRNLERFLVVGLTERFDESFILIRRALGWRLPMYETRNATKGPKPTPPAREALDLIRDRNRLDLELYEHARRLFSAAVDHQGASFRHEVSAFKALNRIPNAIGPRIPTAWRQPLRSLLPR